MGSILEKKVQTSSQSMLDVFMDFAKGGALMLFDFSYRLNFSHPSFDGIFIIAEDISNIFNKIC